MSDHDHCDYCGRIAGWSTLIHGDHVNICDDCVQLCVLTLEKVSIGQRIDGLRAKMQDAIDYERAKNTIAALEKRIEALTTPEVTHD